MADPVSSLSSLAREAFAAARARVDQGRASTDGAALDRASFDAAFERRAQELFERAGPAGPRSSGATPAAPAAPARGEATARFSEALAEVDAPLKAAEDLPVDVLTGRVTSPAEIAATIKRADLTLKYSLEIRNRLVDAYREVMRMSV